MKIFTWFMKYSGLVQSIALANFDKKPFVPEKSQEGLHQSFPASTNHPLRPKRSRNHLVITHL